MFSPRDTPVQLTARELSSGGLVIEVIDSGIGIPGDVLADINQRLDNPPVVDVSISRHMGLFAVARLAERHGIRIRLRARSPEEGIIALVWLPDSIIQDEGSPFRKRRPAFGQIGAQGKQTMSAAPPTPPRGTKRPAAVASTKWFGDPRASGGVAASGQSPGPTEPPGNGAFFRAARIAADPVRGSQADSGLPRRVPRANLIPGSMDGARQAETDAPGYQADRDEAPAPVQPWPPEQYADIARSRMRGFQSGVRRGKSQTPRAGEGSDHE